jgi:hypothetical protein
LAGFLRDGPVCGRPCGILTYGESVRTWGGVVDNYCGYLDCRRQWPGDELR